MSVGPIVIITLKAYGCFKNIKKSIKIWSSVCYECITCCFLWKVLLLGVFNFVFCQYNMNSYFALLWTCLVSKTHVFCLLKKRMISKPLNTCVSYTYTYPTRKLWRTLKSLNTQSHLACKLPRTDSLRHILDELWQRYGNQNVIFAQWDMEIKLQYLLIKPQRPCLLVCYTLWI